LTYSTVPACASFSEFAGPGVAAQARLRARGRPSGRPRVDTLHTTISTLVRWPTPPPCTAIRHTRIGWGQEHSLRRAPQGVKAAQPICHLVHDAHPPGRSGGWRPPAHPAARPPPRPELQHIRGRLRPRSAESWRPPRRSQRRQGHRSGPAQQVRGPPGRLWFAVCHRTPPSRRRILRGHRVASHRGKP